MSIHPNYASAILRGEKRVEFRKRRIADDVTHILLYATVPVAAIIGAFTVAGQATSTPDRLWQIFGEVGGISYDQFTHYYRSLAEGTCIQIGQVFLADEHLKLTTAFGMSRPPQSFQYVDAEHTQSLLECMRPIPC